MPLEQTITVINNSGKIISSGKQFLSLFKEAKASYEEKKAEIRAQKGLQRAQTFDVSHTAPRGFNYHDDYYSEYGASERRGHRRQSYDDNYSETSSRRSHRSRDSRATHSKRYHDNGAARSRLALTETNLKTLSEVSSVAPSRAPPPAPAPYQSPYAETLPRDMAMSKMDLNRGNHYVAEPSEWGRRSLDLPPRPTEAQLTPRKPAKEIDMNLAYGNVPPDLATRYDLDPAFKEHSEGLNAKALVKQVEGLLDEAHCLQHSATSMISKLQDNPDTAANVALTLADLSSAVAKVSPAVLAMLKGSSPAVFALLASPQFLIGTSVMVGITVVMFGGWKIVKKVKENQAAREALALEGVPMDRPAPLRTQTEVSTGMDEALVLDERLEEELSTIETWRRGIQPFGENESADYELITPRADRETRERNGKDDFDTKSHRSTKTTKTNKTSKTAKTSKTTKTTKSSKREEIPERQSSRRAPASEAGSERSRKSTSSRRREVKAIEDGKSRKGDDDDVELSLRPRPQRGDNMLKALFKSKRDRERGSRSELVLA